MPTPTRIASCWDLRKCVIALVSGPGRAVCRPGARAMWESKEVVYSRLVLDVPWIHHEMALMGEMAQAEHDTLGRG